VAAETNFRQFRPGFRPVPNVLERRDFVIAMWTHMHMLIEGKHGIYVRQTKKVVASAVLMLKRVKK
jgi:hypothetical protein